MVLFCLWHFRATLSIFVDVVILVIITRNNHHSHNFNIYLGVILHLRIVSHLNLKSVKNSRKHRKEKKTNVDDCFLLIKKDEFSTPI